MSTPDPIRNRIKGLKTIQAKHLRPDPRNFRRHPDYQRDSLSEMLVRVGYVDAVVARETEDGYVIVDGHLRADLDPEAQLPVLVVDIDEDEAGEVLATFDPLSAMAEVDVEALQALLDAVPPLPIGAATISAISSGPTSGRSTLRQSKALRPATNPSTRYCASSRR